MRHIDAYRDPHVVRRLVDEITRTVSRPWSIMEVCGGQTHSIVRFGIDRLLPDTLTLVHGPGCPVCVTPVATIDQALDLAGREGVVFCTFGDMLRVPGAKEDLFAVKARGGDVRVVYSPMDALAVAEALPDKLVVFFAVGFETTAPGNAMVVKEAARRGLVNFFVLCAHVCVPPAMAAILAGPERAIDAFLAAGHVCTVMGLSAYEALAARYRVPIVATGFEPVDLLHGILLCVRQLEQGRAEVENAYPRAVDSAGNRVAQDVMAEVFEPVDRDWRGIGILPASGLMLRPAYQLFDALEKFNLEVANTAEHPDCRSGLVLQGRCKPHECPSFGTRCTPQTPLGAPMVSAEGACAAYYRYRPVAL